MADIMTADIPHSGHLSDWAVELLLNMKTGSKKLPNSISLKSLCKEGYEVACARFSDWTELIFIRKNIGDRNYEDVLYYNSTDICPDDEVPYEIRNDQLFNHFISELQRIIDQL